MKQSAIYKITNTVTAQFYIGSAVDVRFRLYRHFHQLVNNKHQNIKLQRSFTKYGALNFTKEIIELCEKDNLIPREQYYLDTLKPYFNICKVAGNTLGIKHTPEAIEKMKKFQKEYFSTRQGTLKGKKHRPESIEKMRLAQTGKPTWNKGIARTDAEKKKMSDALGGGKNWRCIPVIQKTMDGIFIAEFHSMRAASIGLKIGYTGIKQCCKGVYKHSHGFKWEYKNKQYFKL